MDVKVKKNLKLNTCTYIYSAFKPICNTLTCLFYLQLSLDKND